MDKQVDPAVQERVRALCRQITVAHDFDAEIQEELYGHMEDKLLAYLAGEEKLSPDDAFILVREHFGNPEALQEVLQAVHEPGVRVSLPRRLTAALVATTGIGVPVGLLCNAALIALGLFGTRLDSFYAFVVNVRFWMNMAPQLISSLLLWCLLLRWQRRLAQGQHLWFVRWPAQYMWAAAGAALIAPLVIPEVRVILFPFSPTIPGLGFTGALLGFTIWVAVRSICGVAWLWWTDRTPGMGRKLKWVFLSMLLLGGFSKWHPSLWPGLLVSSGELPLRGAAQTLATGTLFGTQVHWSFIWAEESLAMAPSGKEALMLYGVGFAWIFAPVLLAFAAYLLARRIQRWTAGRDTQGQVIA
ncbi:MAG: hypothetical protein RBU21_22370 [FCB group bacterium]|jgi:hypothetical protein|nr:hypothetical protein [FCB group bacterium]